MPYRAHRFPGLHMLRLQNQSNADSSLFGVAHIEFDVVGAIDGKKIVRHSLLDLSKFSQSACFYFDFDQSWQKFEPWI
jgi:hypothetical protein